MARPFDDPDRIRHMVEAAEKALELAKGKRRRDFDDDELLQLALAHLVQVIGEAASRVTDQTRDEHSQVPWSDIVGMRHRIVHNYYEVKHDILWQTVKKELRPLIRALNRILKPAPKPSRPRKRK